MGDDLARYRKRRGRYHSYSRRDYGHEAARQHIADAHRLSERLGGMDKEVKDYFFSLPPDQRARVFDGYGRKYGEQKRAYAEATFSKWKNGTVHMSGLVAERLFDFLPPIMPINLKLRIVEGLFENSGAARSDFVLAPLNAPASTVIAFVGDNLLKELEGQQIAAGLKSQFGWLAGEDATVAEQLLMHSLNLTVNAKKAAAAAIMRQMDQSRAENTDVIKDVISTIRVRKHEVHIKRTEAVNAVAVVDRWTFERGGRKHESASGGGFNWFIWLALGLGVLWLLSSG